MKRRIFRHSKPARKRQPRNKTPTIEDPKKDVAINIIADENIDPEYDEIFDKRYFGKYPRGQKPYGFTTGITFEERNKDCDDLRLVRKKMKNNEVDRLNDMVQSQWIRCAEKNILRSKVPAPVQSIIKSYAATPAVVYYQHDFQKIFGGR